MSNAGQETEKRRLSLFRRSKGRPSTPETPSIQEITDSDVRKTRFSLFRNSGRRSGLVLDATLFDDTETPSTDSSKASSDDPSDEESSKPGAGDVSDERDNTLSILEGRVRPALRSSRVVIPRRENAQGVSTDSTIQPSTTGHTSASFVGTLSVAVIPGRPRSGSGASRRSLSAEGRRRSSLLGRVPEDSAVAVSPPARVSEESEREQRQGTDDHALPTYASATYPSLPVTYRFAQAGPFAVMLSPEDDRESKESAGLGRYHIEVGVNVWAPKSSVTSVRRGLVGDGPLIAQIEFGCTASVFPTLTWGESCKPLKDILSKSLANGSRAYHVGDGTTIHWKLTGTQWKACFDSMGLATFTPTPPRTLVVQPFGHRFFDHIVIGVLLLMREQDDSAFARPDYGILTGPLHPF